MSRENVEVIQRVNAAFNTGDYEAMMQLLHPEAEFSDLMPLPDVGQSARGRDEIRVILDA
jgi:ketosteroid isomerase-like protein